MKPLAYHILFSLHVHIILCSTLGAFALWDGGWIVEHELGTDRGDEVGHGVRSQASKRRSTGLERPVCDRDSGEIERLIPLHELPQQETLLITHSV